MNLECKSDHDFGFNIVLCCIPYLTTNRPITLYSFLEIPRESQKEYSHKQSRIVSYSPLALLHITNLYGAPYHCLERQTNQFLDITYQSAPYL